MNILVTSAGRRTYLINYFKEALKGGGKVFASNSVATYTLTQADDHIITPQIYDEGYIDFLIKYCKANAITAIISLFDIDLPILSANKDRFLENGIKVIVSDLNAIEICNDKWKTYEFLRKLDIDTPTTYKDLQNAKEALSRGEIKYPVFVKPRWGMGSIGIYRAENEEELDVLYKKLEREIFKTYLKFESEEDSSHCILIQECIAGKEFGLDVLNDLEGNYVTTIAKEKIAMRSGETDIATIVDAAPFEEISKKIAENLGHIANLDIDCFITSNAKVFVLEMNCRFGGQYPFSHLAGVNFPRQIIQWLEGGKTDLNLVMPRIGTSSCKDLVPVVIPNFYS